MDIFKLLRQDHETIKGILSQLCETSERATKSRLRLFTQFKREFTLHATLEEELFYPLLMTAGKEDRFHALEAVEEHQAVRLLIRALDRTPLKDERWLPRLMVIQENIHHHISEEERSLFKRAKQIMTRGLPGELGEQAEAYKQQHGREIQRGAPRLQT